MSLSDAELAELESAYARMLIEHTLLAEQMVPLAQKILSERAMRTGPREDHPQHVAEEYRPKQFRSRAGTRPPFEFPPLPPADPGDDATEDSSSL